MNTELDKDASSKKGGNLFGISLAMLVLFAAL